MPLPCPILGLTINLIPDGSEYNEEGYLRPGEMLRWSDIILPPEVFPVWEGEFGDRPKILG